MKKGQAKPLKSLLLLFALSAILFAACSKDDAQETTDIQDQAQISVEAIPDKLLEQLAQEGLTAGFADLSRLLPADFTSEAHQSGLAADGLHLVRMIEASHPIFVVEGMLADDYEAVREEFLNYVSQDISLDDFTWAAFRFAAVLQDGHMGMGNLISKWSDEIDAPTRRRALADIQYLWFELGHPFDYTSNPMWGAGYLDEVWWTARDGQLFLLDENDEETGEEITAIGGIATTRLLAEIDAYFFPDNEIGRHDQVHGYFAYSLAVLERGGVDVSGDTVTLTLQNSDGQASERVAPLWRPEMAAEEAQSSEAEGGSDAEDAHAGWEAEDAFYIIRYEMLGDDVFFIDLRSFMDGDHIAEAAAAIEQAVSDGVRRFVVDLRGNSGGNFMVGVQLLGAMGIEPPGFGSYIRVSELTAIRGTDWGISMNNAELAPYGVDYLRREPSMSVVNAHDVFVSVLTDGGTYSAATMFATVVRDGGLGNLVGQPSQGSPNFFGDTMVFELPYSGRVVNVTGSYIFRPDTSADPLVLWPDIAAEPEEALDIALAHLREEIA